jgi:DNA adenine methylase
MPITNTPLRYPGGKSRLQTCIAELLQVNQLLGCTYIEPFAGGCGLALSLLFKGVVKRIIINDFDYCIFAFWYCVLNQTDQLLEALQRVPVTIDEWHRQREVQKEPHKHSVLDVALSTLFLNRTNRSGILKGGVIGGIEQKGRYKLDCRFNKRDLTAKIRRIASWKDEIELHNMDAMDLIPTVIANQKGDTLVYLDPPYITQGNALYCNSFDEQGHIDLSTAIKEMHHPWVLTYDKEPMVYRMYEGFIIREMSLTYSAGSKRKGIELMVFANNIRPVFPTVGPLGAQMRK